MQTCHSADVLDSSGGPGTDGAASGDRLVLQSRELVRAEGRQVPDVCHRVPAEQSGRLEVAHFSVYVSVCVTVWV